jgi:hypothetical protein
VTRPLLPNTPFWFPNGSPIQHVEGTGTRVNLTAAAVSSNSAIPSGATAVKVTALDNVWLNFGTGAVTASAATTSILHYSGVDMYSIPDGATHVAVLRVGSSDVPVQVERVS